MGSQPFPSIHGVKSWTEPLQNYKHTVLFTKSENSKRGPQQTDQLGLPYFTTLAFNSAAYYAGKYTITMDGKRNCGPHPIISQLCLKLKPGADAHTHTHHTSMVHLPALQVVQRRLMQQVKLTHTLHGARIFTSMFPKHHPKVGI